MIHLHVSDDGQPLSEDGPFVAVVFANSVSDDLRGRFKKWIKAVNKQLAAERKKA